ncbi:outer membrane protein transport protein [Shimia aestuarii]|uniref:outer membrane protein transport protein n=2 Tax=Shimia TaxID=573139 RepID=UPI001FB1BCBA|nr:outer membrane protein transport protein [Shimia aestuarii]
MATSTLALCAGQTIAGGLDRSGQSTSAIFNEPGTASLSYGSVQPSVTGTDALGNSYDVAEDYQVTTLSYTGAFSDKLTYALIIDQPYGANVSYGNSPLTSVLGGTMADLSSDAATFVARYAITDRFSILGGVSIEGVQGNVSLNGLAYQTAIATSAVTSAFNSVLPNVLPDLTSTVLNAALAGSATAQAAIDTLYGPGTFASLAAQVGTAASTFVSTGGYKFAMQNDTSIGYLIGAAYEIPDIALRLAATYRFETEHSASTTENLLGITQNGTVDYVTPQSFNLDFQTGIAQNTLLTANFRWTDFSSVDVVPDLLGNDLVNLENARRFSLGIARRFSDSFAGSVSISYEPDTHSATVSPLGPTDGLYGLTIGGRYTHKNINITGGVNYTWLGDANAGVAGVPVASFNDNHVIGVGLKAEITF